VRQVDEGRGSKEQETTKTGSGRKILVIDDSLMLLSFVGEILGELGYQVTTAATAEEGLKAAADVPHLILLDYVLPDMKGDEVSRRLSTDPKTEKVPVLYMSGLGTDLKASKGANPNVIGFLNKPFTSETLLKTIETYIPKSTDATEAKAGNVESMAEEDTAATESAEQVPQFAAVIEETAEKKPEFAVVIEEPVEKMSDFAALIEEPEEEMSEFAAVIEEAAEEEPEFQR